MCSSFLRRSIVNLSILWLGTLFTVHELQNPQEGQSDTSITCFFGCLMDKPMQVTNTACKSRGNWVVLLQ